MSKTIAIKGIVFTLLWGPSIKDVRPDRGGGQPKVDDRGRRASKTDDVCRGGGIQKVIFVRTSLMDDPLVHLIAVCMFQPL